MAGSLIEASMSFGLSYFVAAASPGPNFVIVSRAGLSASRAAAVKTTAGVVLGAVTLTILAATFAQSIPHDGPFLVVTEALFALLLLRWARNSLRNALAAPGEISAEQAADARPLRKGFITAASNPFTALFLTTAISGDMNTLQAVAIVFTVATLWFGIVSLACRQERMHLLYARLRRQVEGLFAAVFVVMAIKTLYRLGHTLAG